MFKDMTHINFGRLYLITALALGLTILTGYAITDIKVEENWCMYSAENKHQAAHYCSLKFNTKLDEECIEELCESYTYCDRELKSGDNILCYVSIDEYSSPFASRDRFSAQSHTKDNMILALLFYAGSILLVASLATLILLLMIEIISNKFV